MLKLRTFVDDAVFVAAQQRVYLVEQPLVDGRGLDLLELLFACVAVARAFVDDAQHFIALEQARETVQRCAETLPVLALPCDVQQFGVDLVLAADVVAQSQGTVLGEPEVVGHRTSGEA